MRKLMRLTAAKRNTVPPSSRFLFTPTVTTALRVFHTNQYVQQKPSPPKNKRTFESYSSETVSYTRDGKTVITKTTTRNGETEQTVKVINSNGDQHEETSSKQVGDGGSVAGKILSGIGSVVLFPVKLAVGALGLAAMHLIVNRLVRRFESTIGKVVFGKMTLVQNAQESIQKKLQSMKMTGQISTERAHEDYIMLQALRILQTHPIVHETLAKQIYLIREMSGRSPRSTDGSEQGAFQKVSGFFTSMFSSKKEVEKRIDHYALMTDTQMVQHARSLVSPVEIHCRTEFVLLAVEDDESGVAVKEIERFQEEYNKIKAENPHFTEQELLEAAQRINLNRSFGALSTFRIAVEATRTNKPGAPYTIHKIEMLETDSDDVLLSLDNIVTSEVEEEAEYEDSDSNNNEERTSSSFKAKQIIEADYTEK